jgi:hypothetical protein
LVQILARAVRERRERTRRGKRWSWEDEMSEQSYEIVPSESEAEDANERSE